MEEDQTKEQQNDSEELEDSASTTATTDDTTQTGDDETTEDESTDESTEDSEKETTSDESTSETTTEESGDEQSSRRKNERLEKLIDKLRTNPSSPTPQTDNQPNKPIIDEGDYSLDEINAMAKSYGEQQKAEGVAIANALAFQTRLEIDAPKVASKYPALDQNSEKFDPGQAALVNEMYLRSVGYDPNLGTVQRSDLRYEEFADGLMSVIETAASTKAADSQASRQKQAAQTGPRPSNTVQKTYQGSDPSKMSDAQLASTINQMLGITPR